MTEDIKGDDDAVTQMIVNHLLASTAVEGATNEDHLAVRSVAVPIKNIAGWPPRRHAHKLRPSPGK